MSRSVSSTLSSTVTSGRFSREVARVVTSVQTPPVMSISRTRRCRGVCRGTTSGSLMILARIGVYRRSSRNGSWRQTNASRYIRRFQSRRSLLIWKIMGARLDGWSNADHPTEFVPGDAGTLPAGASPNEADLDFTGTIMPPPRVGLSRVDRGREDVVRTVD